MIFIIHFEPSRQHIMIHMGKERRKIFFEETLF